MFCLSKQEIEKIIPGEWLILPPNFTTISAIFDDNRSIISDSLFIAIAQGHNFIKAAINQGATMICIDRPIDNALLEFCNEKQIACRLTTDSLNSFHQCAKYWRSKLSNIPVIGLTGSCGKTTTKEILASIFEQIYPEQILKTKENWNNHFGLPRMVLTLNDSHKIGILEMGTNHPGEIKVLTQIAQPDIALITNIGHAHIEFFKNTEGIAQEKSSIFHGLSLDGTAIFDYNAPHHNIILNNVKPSQKILTFGLNCPLADINVIYHGCNEKQVATIELIWTKNKHHEICQWNYTGAHQASNAAAAAAVATAMGLLPQQIVKGIHLVPTIKMRMEKQIINNICWINDAYNANPDSMQAGLHSLYEQTQDHQKVVIVIGDMLELGDLTIPAHFNALKLVKELFPQSIIFAIGKYMKENENLIQGIHYFSNTDEATPILRSCLQSGQTIYLKGSRSIGLEKLILK